MSKKKTKNKFTKNICIFGSKDSEAGQIYSMFEDKIKKKIRFFISLDYSKKIKIIKGPHKFINNVKGNKFFGIDLLKKKDYLKILKKNKIKECYIATSNIDHRKSILMKMKKNGIKVSTFVHKSVKISKFSKNNLGVGSIIFPNSYIGHNVLIGECVIIQSNCSIDHHNHVDDFCNLAPRVTTGGFTKIKKFCEIGISVTIINRVTIQENNLIGAGSLVLKNTKKNSVYYGVPAKFIRAN